MKRVFILALILSFSVTLLAREPLTFEQRVKAQEAIEKVYYSHRIWPKENKAPKPAFEKMVPKETIEAKVTDYLKKSAALENYWYRPITGEQLQAEMNRMVKGTKDRATLNELFEALNNDPYLIAECLARPVLADRLVRNWYANDDRFHLETLRKAQEALGSAGTHGYSCVKEGNYARVKYLIDFGKGTEYGALDENSVMLDENEFLRQSLEAPVAGLSPEIRENGESFVIMRTLVKNESEVEIESLSFPKRSLEDWLKGQKITVLPTINGPACDDLRIPPIPEGVCLEGWDNALLDNVADPKVNFTAIWSGSEMIVWGGFATNTGSRYDPATDTWTMTGTGVNCPSPRSYHTAVWTGSEMIVWGGDDNSVKTITGGRYNPGTDSWASTSTGSNCPAERSNHSAVWTGTEMIIWGGEGATVLNTGGRYNPANDSWIPTSTGDNCPSFRYDHSAVWTGSTMIIWGGHVGGKTGGRYNPSTDTWETTSSGDNCPSARYYHTATWCGNQMIVWGGMEDSTLTYMNDGGRYDPGTDAWTAISTGTNCPSARINHSAVWGGSEMIVWGGFDGAVSSDSGGKYDPSDDTWTPTSTLSGCPTARHLHKAVWTGTEMIIWGGLKDSSYYPVAGGRYEPSSDTWVPTTEGANVPLPRTNHSVIWTGSEMIVWGGKYGTVYLNSGGKYSPSLDLWTSTSTGVDCPAVRYRHSAVWTGTEMIIWGGYGGSSLNSGSRYSPSGDLWTPTSTGTGCPTGRIDHTAVWTGSKMIVWGGYASVNYFKTGGAYDPLTNSWLSTSTGTNCPSGRRYHTGIWTGSEMIVWGGYNGSSYYSSGGRYNPSLDTWQTTYSGTGCPFGRYSHSAVWTGSEMIVWGGYGGANLPTGGRYSPSTNTWTATYSGASSPTGRSLHTAIWTGSEMVVWGGYGTAFANTGGRYNPLADEWTATFSGEHCPFQRAYHKAVWTGKAMIVWGGGDSSSLYLQSGGAYYIPQAPSGFTSCSATDLEECADTGVLINWGSPGDWTDGGGGVRSFDVLRDGAAIASGLSETTLSYIDTSGDDYISYLYQVRANSGCGLSSTTAGISAADNIGDAPEEVANFNDVYSWDPVSGADGYRLYRGTYSNLPNLMSSASDGCLRYQGTATSFDISADDPSPEPEKLFWYLVTAYTGPCEGTAGEGTGFTRNIGSSGNCE